MTDTNESLREHEYVCERIHYAMAKGQDALAVKVLQDELEKARSKIINCPNGSIIKFSKYTDDTSTYKGQG